MNTSIVGLSLLLATILTTQGQGLINFNNSSAVVTKISTNSVVGGAATGLTAPIGGQFYYALYYSTNATSVGGQTNAIAGNGNSHYAFNDSNWKLAAYGTNTLTAGRLIGVGGSSVAIPNVPGGSNAQFVVVGWSANIGTNIAALQAWFGSPAPYPGGYLGQSDVSGPVLLGDGGIYVTLSLFTSTYPGIHGFTLGLVDYNQLIYWAPYLYGNPTNRAVEVGATTTFSVSASGGPTPSYQWLFNGTNLAGATNTSLTLTNVQLTQAGNYSVVVSNMVGLVVSSNALLSVISPVNSPIILSQPVSVSVGAGTNAAFTVSATGSSPLSYQWSFNSTNLPNATNATLVIFSAQPTNAGNYFVSITNAFGATNSATAILTVQTFPPIITSQPTGLSLQAGNGATFTVSATGAAPLSYQWTFNGTNLVNGTNASLVLSNVQTNNAGNYAVIISNAYGITNSATATLTVQTFPPFITSQPVGLSVQVGNGATFTVGVTGTAPLNYQWIFNGTNLPNATNVSLALSNVQSNNMGNYSVVISNPYGVTNSANAALAVTVPQNNGYLLFFNLGVSATKIFTNSTIGGPVTGLTDTNLGGYYYALFASTSASTVNGITTNITGAASSSYAFDDPAWTLVAYATNTLIRGRFTSASAISGQTPVSGFAPASAPRFVVVGWSAGIGTNITAVKNWFNFGFPNSDGWIGQSAVSGAITLGDGGIIPSPSLFGPSAPRLQGFTLGLASPNMVANYPPPVAPAPIISSQVVGSSIKLLWPGNFSNYKPQSASGIGAAWNDLSPTPQTEGTNLTVTVPIAGSGPYFRLIVQ